MNPDPNKVQLLHPDPAKKLAQIDKAKYDPLQEAATHVLRQGDIRHSEFFQRVQDHFTQNQIPFEGNLAWYLEGVKLDLEARGIIGRVGKKSPVTYTLKGG